jgi:SAM-dependent MidA family methyltransferase
MSDQSFAPSDSPNRLEQKIRRLILDQGPITFCRFMEMALYDLDGGYYQTKNRIIGRKGDFVTSPEMGPLFGRLIAIYLFRLWKGAGCSRRIQVREFGAGQGRLCWETMNFLQLRMPELLNALRYRMIERGAAMRQQIQLLIEPTSFAKQCEVLEIDDINADPEVMQVIVANEFLDAFPVHWAACRKGHLVEKYVSWIGGSFGSIEREPSEDCLRQYWQWLGVPLLEGQEVTTSFLALDWLESISTIKSAVHLLIVDYGFLAEDLPYRPGRYGAITCYHGQKATFQPLENVGGQDITAHVNFSALMKRGLELGFSIKRFESQLSFLLELVSSSHSWFDWEDDLELRMNLKELIHPEHMGETFKVLELSKSRQ